MKNMILLAAASMPIVLFVSCSGDKNKAAVVEEKAVAVAVSQVKTDTGIIKKTYTGTIEGIKQASLYSTISEAVVELPVAKGNRVEAGQPVIILDKNGPSSRYTQAYAQYIDAKDNFEKMGRLYQQGAISEQSFNSVKTGYEIAQANFAAARQQVELTSPISGILTDLAVNIGDYVPIGIPIATVAEISKMRITIFVESRGADYIRKGQEAVIFVDISGQESYEFSGVVTEVATSADPATRLFRVEIQFENIDNKARPGMFARAVIAIRELQNVLVIPKESVFTVEGISKAFKVNRNRASEVTISIGESTQDMVQVISGLNVGDSVVTLGRTSIVDGSLVKVTEEPTASYRQ